MNRSRGALRAGNDEPGADHARATGANDPLARRNAPFARPSTQGRLRQRLDEAQQVGHLFRGQALIKPIGHERLPG